MKKTYLLIYVIFICILYSLNGYGTGKIVSQKAYSSVVQISGEKLLLLMKKCTMQRQYDSVGYYYDMIEKNVLNDSIAGTAELYISEKYIAEKKYFKAIVVLYKSLDLFVKTKQIDKQVTAYLKLARLYKQTESIDLSKEVDTILMNTYLTKPISKLQKSQILINHASYIASLKKNEEAVHLLNSLKFEDFSEDSITLRYYYTELLGRYLKLKIIDSAYKYIEKVYENTKVSLPEDDAMKNIIYGMISLREMNYKKALKYISNAKKSPNFKYVQQFELIKLYNAEVYAYKKLRNFEKAMEASEKYLSIRNSVKNFNLSTNASVLNFKLNRDKKIKALEAENKMNAIIMEEKKKFYIFSTFLVSVSVSILIFIIILHKRKKKRLKLEYENVKMKEIAEIKNNFIENLSHEIRTPITITTGYLQLISNNAMDYSKIVKYSDVKFGIMNKS